MSDLQKQSPSDELDQFFNRLAEFGEYQYKMVGTYPKRVHIAPPILLALSRIPGFFQREELRTEATEFSRVVSRIKFSWGVVHIREDPGEVFLHFE